MLLTETGEEFVNPYNFISIDGECKRAEVKKGPLTGVLHCTLKTLTPLVIPNTTCDEAFAKQDLKNDQPNSYDFFSYEDLSTPENKYKRRNKYARPIIPGSELRGCIRSLYEAVTNSCFCTVRKDELLYKRTSVPKKPGLLVKRPDGYYLLAAEKVKLRFADCNPQQNPGAQVEISKFHTGQEVWIKKETKKFTTKKDHTTSLHAVTEISTAPKGTGWEKGHVLIGEKSSGKHHEAVMIKPKPAGLIEPRKIEPDEYDRLLEVWRLYQPKENNGVNQSITRGVAYKNYMNLDKMPVYYNENYKTLGKLYLSPACITKEVFTNTISGLLEKQGGFQPCNPKKEKFELCPACSLFGMVGEDGSEGAALGSRVRFSDAEPIVENNEKTDWKEWYESTRVLPELASPKITSTEFYMEDYSNDYDTWNYDYASKWDPENHENIEAKLRGRKFYWHRKNVVKFDDGALYRRGTEQREGVFKRTVEVRPVKGSIEEEKKFGFKIFFENLADEELKKLIWTLQIGENKPNERAHKLGRAKPLGYGSVQIQVKKVELRSVELKENEIKYSMCTCKSNEYASVSDSWVYAGEEPLRIQEIKRIADFSCAKDDVKYPILSWFASNRGTVQKPSIKSVLPKITDDEPLSKTTSDEPASDTTFGGMYLFMLEGKLKSKNKKVREEGLLEFTSLPEKIKTASLRKFAEEARRKNENPSLNR